MSGARKLGRFRLVRRLGLGGLAEIHLAMVEGPGGFRREVAIKQLHPHLRANPAMVKLFLQEARITATLHHPNIVQVHELEENAGEPFMVLEYVDGLDLRLVLDLLASRGEVLPSDLCLVIAIEIARALQYAHAVIPPRAGRHPPVIHRDLSPGNVMISSSGTVKLLDFGVAKTLLGDDAADEVARGKWPYMSPEQVRGERLDQRSDLFSLGSVLFELLTGRQAFSGRSVVDSMRKVEQADLPPAPGVDPVLETILNKLLARQREERFGNAEEALTAMLQVLRLRGWASGERALAELVARLGAGQTPDAEDSGFEDDETSLLRAPPKPETAMNGRLVPGKGQAETSAVTVALPHARGTPPSVQAGEPFGLDDVTLPPLATHGNRPMESEGHRIAAGPSGDEEAEVTADGTTSVNGQRPRHPAPSERSSTRTKGALDKKPVQTVMPSEPRIYFDHFMPDDAIEDEDASPGLWTPRNLLVLGLALLAILIAGLAVLIAVRQQTSQTKDRSGITGGPSRPRAQAASDAGPLANLDAGHAIVAPLSMDGGAAHPPPSGSRKVQGEISSNGPRERPSEETRAGTAPKEGGSDGLASQGGTSPNDELPRGQPPKGAPQKGQLDIITRPPGAQILLDGKRRGTSPLRLDVPCGIKVQVALSMPRRGLYRTPLWMPQDTGRRLNVIMPFLTKAFHEAKPGRTSIRVRCRSEGLDRVFFNNVDTGFDCPTPPISTLPIAHSVSVYKSQTQRFHWKQVRPRPGEIAEVVFP